MKKEKAAAKYAAMYANELAQNWSRNYDDAYSKYYDKYLALVTSEDYESFDREHGKNISLPKIYAALATCFVSTDYGFSFEDSKNVFYGMAKPAWDRASKAINFIERLPGGFWLFTHLLYRFNESYGSSIQYSQNQLGKDKYEYVISKCAYIEIFEYYGIRNFCKVMCDSDIGVMGKACKHAKFVRYHDMTQADTCHDAVVRVRS